MTPNCTNDKSTAAQTPIVRPATQAGRFYESDSLILAHEVDSLFDNHADITPRQNLAAVIAPHAGYYFSGNVAAAAFKTIDPDKKYKRIFLLGPSHYEWVDGASVNKGVDYYSTPLGKVKVDCEVAQKLIAADSVFKYKARAHDREHCLEVQLPFLQRRMKEVPPIVPIIISTNDYSKLVRIAEALKPYFNDDNLFVISSDFSHYPSYKDAYRADGITGKAVESGDVEQFITSIESNARSGMRNLDTSACGEFAIITLMLMLDRQCEIEHLLYQNSGDIDPTGRDRVVGYHAFAICRNEKNVSEGKSDDTRFSLTKEEKKTLKEIARQSIMAALESTAYKPTGLTPTLYRKCGAFVSLHKHGQLRGCIGHFGEDTPLYEIVSEMAQAAAFEDPRFHPVSRDELKAIDIEISVLTPMQRIYSIDEFQLHKHGIYIKKGYRSGTFLPQVADEVDWTKEEFLGHCSRDKAGLGWDGWRDAELYIYEAIVF